MNGINLLALELYKPLTPNQQIVFDNTNSNRDIETDLESVFMELQVKLDRVKTTAMVVIENGKVTITITQPVIATTDLEDKPYVQTNHYMLKPSDIHHKWESPFAVKHISLRAALKIPGAKMRIIRDGVLVIHENINFVFKLGDEK